MTLTDTGPLVALINVRDPHHRRCLAIASRLPAGPLVTTWPCFTEAMYLLHRAGGHPAQAALWRLLAARRLNVLQSTPVEVARMEQLMRDYRDAPMDLADASLLAAAEIHGFRQVFSLDSGFRVFRMHDGSVLEIANGVNES